MDNKILFAIGGLIAGYMICKKRLASKQIADGEEIATKAVDEATKIFNDLLTKAAGANMSAAQLQQHLNAA